MPNCGIIEVAVSQELIVTAKGSKLVVHEMQDHGKVKKRGEVRLAGNLPETAKLYEHLLAVCNWDGEADSHQIHLFSLEDPDHPTHLSATNTSKGTFVGEVVLSQGRAYLANGHAGLVVLDIQDPSDPKQVGSYPDAIWCRGLGITEDHQAVLAMSTHERASWLEVVDISNLSKIERTSRVELYGGTQDVLIQDSLAIVAAKSGGLRIVRIRDSTNQPIVNQERYSGGPYHQLASLDGLIFAPRSLPTGGPRRAAVDVFRVQAEP